MSLETNNISPLISDSAYYLIPPLVTQLRDMARAATWPEEVVQQLDIEFDGESIFITYPDEIASTVTSLEYGYGSDRPNSVLRAFTYRTEPTIKKVLSARLVNSIIDMEGIFDA